MRSTTRSTFANRASFQFSVHCSDQPVDFDRLAHHPGNQAAGKFFGRRIAFEMLQEQIHGRDRRIAVISI